MCSSLPPLCARRAACRPSALAFWLGGLSLVLLSGCASSNWVTLRKSPHNALTEQLSLMSRRGPKPTERTVLLLRRYDLEKDLGGDPKKLLGKMRTVMEREPSADKLYSMAEVAYLSGKKAEITNPARGLELHGLAVLNSYLYLFDERFGRWRANALLDVRRPFARDLWSWLGRLR